jgi:hypothetical protein
LVCNREELRADMKARMGEMVKRDCFFVLCGPVYLILIVNYSLVLKCEDDLPG